MIAQRKPKGRPRKIREEQEIPEALTPRLLSEKAENPETCSQNQIASFAMRIETQEDEKAIAQKTITDLYAEAREQGLSTSLLREAIRLRKLQPHERAAYEALRNQYMQTLGVIP